MLDLFSDPEDGDDILLRNIGIFPTEMIVRPDPDLYSLVCLTTLSVSSLLDVVEKDLEGILGT
jgi:hypothetical protein